MQSGGAPGEDAGAVGTRVAAGRLSLGPGGHSMVGTTGARVHLAVRLLLELGLEGRSIPWHHGLRDARPG